VTAIRTRLQLLLATAIYDENDWKRNSSSDARKCGDDDNAEDPIRPCQI
jgi:hypothetical protein